MNQKTFFTTKKDIVRKIHIIDAKDKILGRLATEISILLQGKNKVYYSHSVDCGDTVKVINADKIKLSGNKEQQKFYFTHSGYLGNEKFIPYLKMKEKHPEKILFLAVKGMLPKNKLRAKMLKRLKIISGGKA